MAEIQGSLDTERNAVAFYRNKTKECEGKLAILERERVSFSAQIQDEKVSQISGQKTPGFSFHESPASLLSVAATYCSRLAFPIPPASC